MEQQVAYLAEESQKGTQAAAAATAAAAEAQHASAIADLTQQLLKERDLRETSHGFCRAVGLAKPRAATDQIIQTRWHH